MNSKQKRTQLYLNYSTMITSVQRDNSKYKNLTVFYHPRFVGPQTFDFSVALSFLLLVIINSYRTWFGINEFQTLSNRRRTQKQAAARMRLDITVFFLFLFLKDIPSFIPIKHE